MKHNKRFLLAALVLLLASMLCSSLALAEEPAAVPITGITIPDTQVIVRKTSGNDRYYICDENGNIYSNLSVGSINSSAMIKYTIVPEPHDGGLNSTQWTVSDETILSAPGYTTLNPNFYYNGKLGTVTIATSGLTAYDKNYDDYAVPDASFNVTFVTVPATSIKTTATEAIKATVGNSYSMNSYIAVEPLNATYDILWKVSDLSIARIDNYGNLKALKAGTVTVTATLKGVEGAVPAVMTVVVEEPKQEKKITAMAFNEPAFIMNKNETIYLSNYMQITGTDYSLYNDIKWTVSDPSIVEIYDDDGDIHARKAGTVTVVAMAKADPTVAATCTITVVDTSALTAITPVQATLTMIANGDSRDMSDYFLLTPSTASFSNDVMLVSSNAQIVRVDGIWAYPKDAGTATITAMSKKDSTIPAAVITVTVTDNPATAIAFPQTEINLEVGDDYSLSNLLLKVPQDAVDNYLWSSSNQDVAYISSKTSSNVSANQVGEATITAYVESDPTKTASILVKVTDKAPTAIAFSPASVTVKAGKSKNLAKYVQFAPITTTASVYDLDWESSDSRIASVEADGYLYTKKPGKVTITATYTTATGAVVTNDLAVEVLPVPVVSAVANEDTITMYLDQYSSSLSSSLLVVKPQNAYYKLTWASSDPTIARVTKEGSLRLRKEGTCTLTATLDDTVAPKQVEIKLVVVASDELDLKLSTEKATINMYKDQKAEYGLYAYNDLTGNSVSVKWSSSDAKVATVNKDGVVTFKKAGTVTITGTSRSDATASASCVFTVKQDKIKSLTGSKKVTLTVGDERYLRYKIKPATAFNKTMKFKSSNTNVVSVDENGLMNAHDKGTAKVTISTTDGSKKNLVVDVVVK